MEIAKTLLFAAALQVIFATPAISQSTFSIPHTGVPILRDCAEGTRVNGTDMIGQIVIPSSQPKTQCQLNFSKSFATAPACVATIGIPFENYFNEIPAIAVSPDKSFVRFIVGKPGDNIFVEMTINYWCAEIPALSPYSQTIDSANTGRVSDFVAPTEEAPAEPLVVPQKQFSPQQYWWLSQ